MDTVAGGQLAQCCKSQGQGVVIRCQFDWMVGTSKRIRRNKLQILGILQMLFNHLLNKFKYKWYYTYHILYMNHWKCLTFRWGKLSTVFLFPLWATYFLWRRRKRMTKIQISQPPSTWVVSCGTTLCLAQSHSIRLHLSIIEIKTYTDMTCIYYSLGSRPSLATVESEVLWGSST